MDHVQREFYSWRMGRRVSESQGQAYEDLFCEIMRRRYPDDFEAVKASGRHGDGGCDGLLESQRQAFAVYAPRQMSSAETVKKISGDFKRVQGQWGTRFDTWVFVHNDSRGLPPDAVRALMDIQQKTGKTTASWPPQRLEDELFMLSADGIARVLGEAPSLRDLARPPFEQIKDILVYIETMPPPDIDVVAPVPFDKIERNDLSEIQANLLISSAAGAARVSCYLEEHHQATWADSLSSRFHHEYCQRRDEGKHAQEVFDEMYDFVAGDMNRGASHAGSVFSVLAYFFQTCDIFEG